MTAEGAAAVFSAADALVQRLMDLYGEDAHAARHRLGRHLLFGHRTTLCPEAEMRAAMPDAEFWEHVAGRPQMDPDDFPGWEPDYDDPDGAAVLGVPCPTCGATGPCGFDAEGLPLIHATPVGALS